jgi:hypothetical protein
MGGIVYDYTMSDQSKPKKLLSLIEVSEQLSLPGKKVLSLCRSGKLPYFLFGDQIRVDAQDLFFFVERSRKNQAQL